MRHLCYLPYNAAGVAQDEHNAAGVAPIEGFFVEFIINAMALFAR